MKALILFRHAKAEPHSPKQVDHDRGLVGRGAKAAAEMGKYLAAHGPKPDLILCSDARRALETMDAALTTLGTKPAVEIDAGLYLTEPKAILHRLRKVGDRFTSVMIIGHNPGLEDLARLLVKWPLAPAQVEAFHKLEGKFPTAAIAVFRFELDSWAFIGTGLGALDAFIVPRDLAEA